MRTPAAVLAALTLFLLASCGDEEAGDGAGEASVSRDVVTACEKLAIRDWSGLALSADTRSYEGVGDDFRASLEEVTRYGLWYHDAGYDQVPDPGLTAEAAEARALAALTSVWKSCTEHAALPTEVNEEVAREVTGGIVKMLVVPSE